MADQEIPEIRNAHRTGANTFTVHGVNYNRDGDCLPCTGCFNHCVNKCPHGIDNGDGTARCGIHDTRDQHCDECGQDHQVCIDFPDHPFVTVIREGVCSYSFHPVDEHMSMRAIYSMFDRRAAGRTD